MSHSIHVVVLQMGGRDRVKLVRVDDHEGHMLITKGSEALRIAMDAFPSAASGRYVGPASPAQVASFPADKDVVSV
jgi:hypothetical protein